MLLFYYFFIIIIIVVVVVVVVVVDRMAGSRLLRSRMMLTATLGRRSDPSRWLARLLLRPYLSSIGPSFCATVTGFMNTTSTIIPTPNCRLCLSHNGFALSAYQSDPFFSFSVGCLMAST